MTVSSLWMSGILISISIGIVVGDCDFYGGYSYCYYYYEIPIGTIIGAVVGGIAGLILLCVLVVVVCIFVCKKKTPGTIIYSGTVSSTVASSAPYNSYPNHPQQHGWGVQRVQPSAPSYPGYGQQQYPPRVSQPMPPPTYAENVVPGQPPQNTN
ncbi:uncharacterized protein LOC125653867 [Ostrea edulis]|uniref:uncharacterized protein LOC125653867 n=1 Tax=Ostrea edulis TaxID=37623 RepID=UPI0024AEA3FB|nr:uncharacterized protein LOC125653867 [Ostrea edulis]